MYTRYPKLLITCALLIGFATFWQSAAAVAESLDGVWEFSMIVTDGRMLNPAEVTQSYSANGLITIAGGSATLITPSTMQPRQIPLRVDASTMPAKIDVALTPTNGGHGVVMVSGTTAIICLGSRDKPRTTKFAAPQGSGNLLISLTRVAAGGQPNTTTTAAAAGVAPNPTPPVAIPDGQLRQQLVGSWGHQDGDSSRVVTFNSDGTMSSVMNWKDQFKKMFHADVRSSGNWKVENGVVVVQFTASTDNSKKGQVYSYRVRSINPTELLAVDQQGQLRREWRVPTQ